ncbi:hypothetical protein ABBQ32_007002 [Trebouxia sp. C0010 RCD-2024]
MHRPIEHFIQSDHCNPDISRPQALPLEVLAMAGAHSEHICHQHRDIIHLTASPLAAMFPCFNSEWCQANCVMGLKVGLHSHLLGNNMAAVASLFVRLDKPESK